MSIPVEGIAPASLRQVYVRGDSDPLNVYFYGYLVNSYQKLVNKKLRITRLRLRFTVKAERPCKFQVINIKREIGDGLDMWHLPQFGEDIFGVQNQDYGFLSLLSSSHKPKVLYEKDIPPGIISQGFVSLETQKWYDYGPEGIPLFMLVATITTIDGLPCRINFTFDRKMEWLIEEEDEEDE